MTEYRKAVEYYASNNIDYLFHNKGSAHAQIIFENIFKNAREHIRISALNLWNTEVVRTKEYLEALKLFLDQPKTKLDILVKSMPADEELTEESDNNIYRILYSHPAYLAGRIRIKTGNGKCFKTIEGSEIHFCTADGHMYRYEDDITERTAQCNFNDSDTAKNFETLFDSAFNGVAEDVNLKNIFAQHGN